MCFTVIHTFSLQSWNSPKRQSISSSSSMSASFELFKSECVERSWLFVNKQPSVTGEGHEFIPYRDVLFLLPRPMLLPECCRTLPKLGTMCKSPSEILSSEFIPNQYYNSILYEGLFKRSNFSQDVLSLFRIVKSIRITDTEMKLRHNFAIQVCRAISDSRSDCFETTRRVQTTGACAGSQSCLKSRRTSPPSG